MDEKYLSDAEISWLRDQGFQVIHILNGYVRWLRDQRLRRPNELRESEPQYGDSSNALETELDATLW